MKIIRTESPWELNIPEDDMCPLCKQRGAVWRRKLNKNMALTLATMWREAQMSYVHTASLPGDTHEASQLSWWGFIEGSRSVRADGGRNGYWKLTKRGLSYLQGQFSVPLRAVVQNAVVRRYEGPRVYFNDCLPESFDLRELIEISK